MVTDRSEITGFENQVAGEFPLHIEHELMRNRRAPVEFHRKRLRRHNDGVCCTGAANPIEPGFHWEGGIVVVARAPGGVAADVEPWIALILVVERSRGHPDGPFRTRAPRDSNAGSE